MDLIVRYLFDNKIGVYTSYTGKHRIYDSVILETIVGTDWSETNNRYYEDIIHLAHRKPDKS